MLIRHINAGLSILLCVLIRTGVSMAKATIFEDVRWKTTEGTTARVMRKPLRTSHLLRRPATTDRTRMKLFG